MEAWSLLTDKWLTKLTFSINLPIYLYGQNRKNKNSPS